MKRSKGGQFVTHAQALPGNPYDGHTLATVIPEIEALTGGALKRILADAVYRGHNTPDRQKLRVFAAGQKRRVMPAIKKRMRRRRPSNRSSATSRTSIGWAGTTSPTRQATPPTRPRLPQDTTSPHPQLDQASLAQKTDRACDRKHNSVRSGRRVNHGQLNETAKTSLTIFNAVITDRCIFLHSLSSKCFQQPLVKQIPTNDLQGMSHRKPLTQRQIGCAGIKAVRPLLKTVAHRSNGPVQNRIRVGEVLGDPPHSPPPRRRPACRDRAQGR